MATRKKAREIVERNTTRYGYLSDDILSQLNAEGRRKLEQNWAILESAAGHSVQTLAKNIYGSGARFVFELLQNADDNSFEKARKKGDTPSISFKVHPDRIIVECNEDGFNERDLNAICAVGQSTKAASYGYIGAKGIGFESVFIAAWKVYIQSRHFSFYFVHEKGDSGLGMIRPIWIEPEEELAVPLTRMTLYIHERGDPEDLEHLRRTIFKQFKDLKKTCLLFLKKIKNISVSFYDDDGNLINSKSFKTGEASTNKVYLETLSVFRGRETKETRQYHITKYTANKIAKSENRDQPETEEARQISSTAEVVLAFPLTSKSVPLLETQEIFAFLPVRESDYKFIIQSDFDTSANRQDVVATSKRNISLLDGIASAFIKAVLEFFEDPNLCYQWPRFLPTLENNSTGFWSRLNETIKHKILTTPIIRSRYRTNPRLITKVYKLGSESKDEHGDCLYDDTSNDTYISKKYQEEDIEILSNYGLQVGPLSTTLNLLSNDLNLPDSRMKDFSTRPSWHSKAANSLTKWAKKYDADHSIGLKIRSLPIIPLQDGQWVSATSDTVYLPTTNGIPVPSDLGFRILDSRVLAISKRKILFECLGVAEASVDLIRTSIKRFYKDEVESHTVEQSISHLHYLYLSHYSGGTRPKVKNLVVFTNARPKNPQKKHIYIANDHPCGPEMLLKPTKTAPGFSAFYLHASYLENSPIKELSQLSWEDWLYDFVGIKRHLPLANSSEDGLSLSFKYIAQHRPDKFLDALEFLWKKEGPLVWGNDKIKKQIRDAFTSDHCEAGPKSTCGPLSSKAWLPVPLLKKHVTRYINGMAFFPFLRINGYKKKGAEKKWAFLHKELGVGKEDDIGFYLEILKVISKLTVTDDSTQRIVDLYQTLEAKITITDNSEEAASEVRRFMLEEKLILSPESEYNSAIFIGNGNKIRWEAPDLSSMRCLEQAYREVLKDKQMKKLAPFFCDTLMIKNASWIDIVKDLKCLSGKEKCGISLDRIKEFYKFIANSKAPKADLKETFVQNRLIYVIKNGVFGWYKSSDCLWSSTSEIHGKVTLNDDYDDLKHFFMQTLGVKSLTLQMIYDELRFSNGQKSVDDIKTCIWSLNSLLQTDEAHLDPIPLLRENIIPVKYPRGITALRNIKAVFAVGDSRKLSARLENHINLLDYNFEEIRRLKPFIHWAKLDERYLSQSVREFTRVSSIATKRPVSQEKFDISRKAYAILRISKTFQSPKYDKDDPESLYNVLREAKVIETDGICSVISISQNGKTTELEESTGMEHIDGSRDKLKIYVPLNKNQRELCFSSLLPAKLADWLMRDWDSWIPNKVDKDAVHILSTILSCDLAVVGQILELNSIFEVEICNQDPQHDEVSSDDDNNSDEEVSDSSQVQSTPSLSSRTDTTDLYGATPVGQGSLSPRTHSYGYNELQFASAQNSNEDDTPLFVESIAALFRGSRRNRFAPLWNEDEPVPRRTPRVQDAEYLGLLNRVIAASRRAAFPSRGAFDMTELLNGLPSLESEYESFDGLDVAPKFRSVTQLERDKMVGAAGELYVFELLSTLRLSSWGRTNWQSTIRKYVTDHPDYEDMEPWDHRETADFVYQDAQGEFTALLIENGYLGEEWRAARPKYLIEVKTSTGPLATPFYMSRNQYRLMQNTHGAENRSEVYIILRVFWLHSDKIGMRVYLDPEQIRQDGGLVFTGETWSIIPGDGGGN